MILGIDASNIRVGGGVTHLVEILKAADPEQFGFTKVIVWGRARIFESVGQSPAWLEKRSPPALELGLLRRLCWQLLQLDKAAQMEKCNILFIPGGSYSGSFVPFVSMSQNLLPFEWRELMRYGVSFMTLKMILLRYKQSRTFMLASGVIFLTEYAKSVVTTIIPNKLVDSTIIPLGLNRQFFNSPIAHKILRSYTAANPCRLLYVSVVDFYKHQWHVASAVAKLHADGYHVSLNIVGPGEGRPLEFLKSTINKLDPYKKFLNYYGPVGHIELVKFYKDCDINVFASSCENMPNILLEAMASGAPLACSNCGPMPEMLGNAGVYFDPESPSEISTAIAYLIDSPNVRLENAEAAYKRAEKFLWKKCANETFAYLRLIGSRHKIDS